MMPLVRIISSFLFQHFAFQLFLLRDHSDATPAWRLSCRGASFKQPRPTAKNEIRCTATCICFYLRPHLASTPRIDSMLHEISLPAASCTIQHLLASPTISRAHLTPPTQAPGIGLPSKFPSTTLQPPTTGLRKLKCLCLTVEAAMKAAIGVGSLGWCHPLPDPGQSPKLQGWMTRSGQAADGSEGEGTCRGSGEWFAGGAQRAQQVGAEGGNATAQMQGGSGGGSHRAGGGRRWRRWRRRGRGAGAAQYRRLVRRCRARCQLQQLRLHICPTQ